MTLNISELACDVCIQNSGQFRPDNPDIALTYYYRIVRSTFFIIFFVLRLNNHGCLFFIFKKKKQQKKNLMHGSFNYSRHL